MVDGVEEKCITRHASRNWSELMESRVLHSASEIVAYHNTKRRFLNLKDMEREDPDQIQICEFNGQDFELIED